MNVTKLEVIADEDAGNIRAGACVAYSYMDDAGWRDPHGGFFDSVEQEYFNLLARGEDRFIILNGGRVFSAHLRAVF